MKRSLLSLATVAVLVAAETMCEKQWLTVVAARDLNVVPLERAHAHPG